MKIHRHAKCLWIVGLSLLATAMSASAIGAEFIVKRSELGPNVDVQLRGAFKKGDSDRFIDAIKSQKPADASRFTWLKIFISSEGGDVDEALRIGRFLRSENALVAIVLGGKCFSSCVFVIAGAVQRSTEFGSVGLHRPFLLKAEKTTDFEATYWKTYNLLKSYLLEMKTPIQLLDLMYSIPPERMRILEEDEKRILFPEMDPVFDEEFTAYLAGRYELTSFEFRKRTAESSRICPDGYTTEQFHEHDECKEALLWGLTIQEYRMRMALVSAVCSKHPKLRSLDPNQPGPENPVACVKHIMLGH